MWTFAARLMRMADGWSPDELLEAVQVRVQQGPDRDGELPMDAMLDGGDLWVIFRWPPEPHLFGIRFPLSEAPLGPSTGEVCETTEEWATEVGWVLMEELGTGLVRWGHRVLTPSGVVELDYRRGAGQEA